jgi:putative FmdB family regulatory protein
VPTYDYQCRSCGDIVEVIHSMLEDGPSVCERCGGELRRVFYPSGIIFKGRGFYKTDSRSTSSASASPSSRSSDAGGGGEGGTASRPGGSTSDSGDGKGAGSGKD